jgi:uncharacterized membrane protein YbhN (UPF0104 family)
VRLSFLTANLICVALVAIDYVARTIRMQCFALGVGARTKFFDIFALNAAGDAASALTPLRAGGEPVRFYGMMAARLSVSDSIAVFAVEGIIEWAVIVAIGGYVGWRFGSEWWQSVHLTLVPRLQHALPFISIIVVIGLLGWMVVHRLLPHVSAQVGGTMKSSLRLATRMPVWVIVVGFLLTAVRVLARVLVLVAVMATADVPPELGTVLVGSFALLYGQNFVPTPSGAGAVEVGFLGGAAGYTGSDADGLLVMWRFYTTLTGIILGLLFGIPHYGSAIRRRILYRRLVARRTLLHNRTRD